MIRLAILLLCLSARAQTNLPTPPHVTAGADVLYSVQCRHCEREQAIAPIAVKILKVKSGLGGELQDCRATFHCAKCGREFTFLIQRWIRNPIRLPAHAVNIQTNYVTPVARPKPVLKSPKL